MEQFDAAMLMLSDHMVLFFIAFAVCFVVTPLMRLLAVKNGIVDRPDLHRKRHLGPVAYLGGVAVFLAWVASVTYCYVTRAYDPANAHLISLVFGAICITLTGLVDDVRNVSPRVKIAGMFLAAGGLALSSQKLAIILVQHSFAGIGLGVGNNVAYILGAALIGLLVLGGCNAVNLLDGLDGLATGVCAIAMAGLLVISICSMGPQPGEYDTIRFVMCLTLLGALLGFLPYNFNPANIFLGDAGSLLIGYLCAATIVVFAQDTKLVVAALVVFALPITDTALAVFRRKMRGQPIFAPDHHHLHHQLLRVMHGAGFSPNASVKLAVLTMYLLSIAFAVMGCALVFLRWRFVLAVALPLFSFVVVAAFKAAQRQGPDPAARSPAPAAATDGNRTPGAQIPVTTVGGEHLESVGGQGRAH